VSFAIAREEPSSFPRFPAQKFEKDFKALRRSLKQKHSSPEANSAPLESKQAPLASRPLSKVVFDPSFCVKTSAKYLKDYSEELRDLYINFCSSDSIDDYKAHLQGRCNHPSHPLSESHSDSDHGYDHAHDHSHHHHHHHHQIDGSSRAGHPPPDRTGGTGNTTSDFMEIPYTIDATFKCSTYKIYTIAFGKRTIRRAGQGDKRFRELLIQTALQAISEKFDESPTQNGSLKATERRHSLLSDVRMQSGSCCRTSPSRR
jgi:hypothetical protein